MGRPRRKSEQPTFPEPEDESQESPDSEPEEFLSPEESIRLAANDNQPPTHGVSKADMVRTGLAEGLTKPGDIADFILKRFGAEISKPMVSSYVAQQRARDRKAAGEESPVRHRTPAAPQQAAIPANFASDIREIRQLVDKLGGADEAKEVIGQLSGLVGRYGAGGLGELIDAIS